MIVLDTQVFVQDLISLPTTLILKRHYFKFSLNLKKMPLSVKSGIYTMTKGILENLKLIHKIQPIIKDEHSELKFSENCNFFGKAAL